MATGNRKRSATGKKSSSGRKTNSGHKRNTKKQQEREAEFTREVILWIVVAVSLFCLSVTLDLAVRSAVQSAASFLVYLELFHIYFQSYYWWGLFLPFRTRETGWQP